MGTERKENKWLGTNKLTSQSCAVKCATYSISAKRRSASISVTRPWSKMARRPSGVTRKLPACGSCVPGKRVSGSDNRNKEVRTRVSREENKWTYIKAPSKTYRVQDSRIQQLHQVRVQHDRQDLLQLQILRRIILIERIDLPPLNPRRH